MGEKLELAMRRDAQFHLGTYTRKPVLFVRGEGTRLYDDDEREYVDFVSGLGAVNLGHSHPAVVEAVQMQVARLTHVSNLYHVEHQGLLAERVAEVAGGGRKVFFANSGAEATEGAIKLARKWGKQKRGEECVGIVTAKNSFHGRTLAALAATGQTEKHGPFAPLPPGFSHVPLNHLGALEEAVDKTTCAVMLEAIQGEGGVNPCEREYLEGVEALCEEREVLFVLDEVQTGCYRTGPAFAHQLYCVKPDVFTLAKSLANGLPVGAVVATDEAADAFGPGDHASTFGGGPVVCAAGVATLGALDDEAVGENAEAIGAYLKEGLGLLGEKTGAITEVRGEGLMIGAELAAPVAAQVADAALAEGIVLNNIGDSILRFLPPLVATHDDVNAALGVVADALAEAVDA